MPLVDHVHFNKLLFDLIHKVYNFIQKLNFMKMFCYVCCTYLNIPSDKLSLSSLKGCGVAQWCKGFPVLIQPVFCPCITINSKNVLTVYLNCYHILKCFVVNTFFSLFTMCVCICLCACK